MDWMKERNIIKCAKMYSINKIIKKENYNMSKVKKYLIMLVIVTITLCSCSMKDENYVLNENKIAVLNEKKEIITALNNMHNQYNAYRICEEDGYVVQQLTLKGKIKKTYRLMSKDKKITMLGVAYVTNKEIFYILDKNCKCELWVIPLEHNKKESVLTKKKRLLFRTSNVIKVLYADDDYIGYKEGWRYKEYNRNLQKKISMNDERKKESYSQPDSFIIHSTELGDKNVNGMIVLSKNTGVNNYPKNIYLHKIGSGKVKKIADTATSIKWSIVLFCSDNRIYYTGIKKERINTQSWDIWCYDFGTNSNFCLLEEKQLKDAASFSEIINIFLNKNELWIETDNEKCKFMYFPIELNEKQSETSIRKSIELNKHMFSLYNENKDIIIVRIGEDQCLIEQLCENFVRIRCFDINEEGEIWLDEQFYDNTELK